MMTNEYISKRLPVWVSNIHHLSMQLSGLTLEVTLPYPPSVNNTWGRTNQSKRGANGKLYHPVYLKKEARDYRSETYYLLQDVRFNDKPVSLTVEMMPPDSRRRDVDNVGKAIFDTLQYAQVIDNDSQIVDYHVRRMDPVKGGAIRLFMCSIGDLHEKS